jgi:nucleoside-diphosphate-sugar epimerase
VRPWYVLGPGHRWPLLLVPFYALARAVPRTRDGAIRLGLVTIDQMIAALVHAIEDPPPAGTARIVDVPAIRASRV